jgi:hypothetical protein
VFTRASLPQIITITNLTIIRYLASHRPHHPLDQVQLVMSVVTSWVIIQHIIITTIIT